MDNENEKSMLTRWPEENLVHGERVESGEWRVEISTAIVWRQL